MESLTHPKFAIASLSLGSYLHHTLPTKITVASALGYQGIEIFFPDFEAFVDEVQHGQHSHLFSSIPSKDLFRRDLERTCATAIATLCKSQNLSIPIIQPLRNFENFTSQAQLDAALDGAERWLDLMPYFDSDLLLVCSNFIEGSHPIQSGQTTMEGYLETQVNAFRLLGERAAKYGVRVGYEPLSWGTVINRWEPVWDVVRRVDMPNVGIILDSFNTLGNQYADPSTMNSLRIDITLSVIHENLALLKTTIPASKLFFYQIADAHRPLHPVPDCLNAPARMTWSRASRLFPCEDGAGTPSSIGLECPTSDADRRAWSQKHTGFLPVPAMTRAVHGTGYSGWWSLEVFNATLMEADEGCPTRHGVRGIRGLERLWAEVGGKRSSGDGVYEGVRGGIMKEERSHGQRPSVTPPLDGGDGAEDTGSDTSELESVEVPEVKGLENITVVTQEDAVLPLNKDLVGKNPEVVETENLRDGLFRRLWRTLSSGGR